MHHGRRVFPPSAFKVRIEVQGIPLEALLGRAGHGSV